MLGLSIVVAATVAVADIDLVAESDLGSRKGVRAVVEDECDVVLDTTVYSRVGGVWVADLDASADAEATCEEEAPFRDELEMWSMVTVDCNGNGIADALDIATGAMDWDSDGVPDACELDAGDLNLNGVVDSQDLSILLGWWGIANPAFGDLNHDGKVDGTDLGILLGRWGAVVF